MNLENISKESLGIQLTQAYHDLSNRGLVKAATWAADALVGLDVELPLIQPPALAPKTMQAKAYFDSKEYSRCWNAIGASNLDSVDSTGRFLRLFSRYHAGEAIKENELGTEIFVNKIKQESASSCPVNPFLDEIQAELESIPEKDAHLLYLHGVILRAKHDEKAALAQLQQSFVMYPFNWSCCLELKHCFTRLVDVEDVLNALARTFSTKSVESKCMFTLFKCFVNDELDPAVTASTLVSVLMPLFPKLLGLLTQLARIYSCEGHYDASAKLFEKVLSTDPFRLDDLDAYSNLLYVQDQRAKLAFLAQHVTTTDKYRSESCCIVANYYSLRGDHEQAVDYYSRAIVLNRNYIPSWTLMGHEFIELGNPHAAIETYRMAVDLVPYDFRPLFGLGQAYEVLGMHYFAQYYFQRALALRPSDVRLWDALGSCYEQLDRDHEAINAFQQALQISEGDIYYTYRLGMLFDRCGNEELAVKLISQCAQQEEGGESADSTNAANGNISIIPSASVDVVSDDMLSEWPSRARLWLAKRAMSLGDWAGALQWARKVQHGTREMLEEARSLEIEARSSAEKP